MSAGPFFVGEQPSSPLTIDLTDSSGAALDLSVYDDVELISEEIPAGTLSIVEPAAGRVQYVFSAPFAVAGTVSYQIRLEQLDGDTDYTPPATFQVLSTTSTGAIVSASMASDITGASVSGADLVRAQHQIGAVLGHDLFDTAFTGRRTGRDMYLLRQAVAYQAAGLGQAAMTVPIGVTAVSQAGLSLSFGAPTGLAESQLSPWAVSLLKRLSWRRRRVLRASAHRPSVLALQNEVYDGLDSAWSPASLPVRR